MALIICPECGKKVSQYAKICLECGFPIQDFMKENNLIDLKKIFICPKCGTFSGGFGEESDPVRLKCKFCKIPLIQTDVTGDESLNNLAKCIDDGNPLTYYERLADEVGGHQLSEEACRYRAEQCHQSFTAWVSGEDKAPQPTNLPTCPICGSTNLTKLSNVGKAAKVGFFGIFGAGDLGKTWKCKNCGSKF